MLDIVKLQVNDGENEAEVDDSDGGKHVVLPTPTLYPERVELSDFFYKFHRRSSTGVISSQSPPSDTQKL